MAATPPFDNATSTRAVVPRTLRFLASAHAKTGNLVNTLLTVEAERIHSCTSARGWPEPQVIEDIASGANLERPGLTSRDRLRPGDATPLPAP